MNLPEEPQFPYLEPLQVGDVVQVIDGGRYKNVPVRVIEVWDGNPLMLMPDGALLVRDRASVQLLVKAKQFH